MAWRTSLNRLRENHLRETESLIRELDVTSSAASARKKLDLLERKYASALDRHVKDVYSPEEQAQLTKELETLQKFIQKAFMAVRKRIQEQQDEIEMQGSIMQDLEQTTKDLQEKQFQGAKSIQEVEQSIKRVSAQQASIMKSLKQQRLTPKQAYEKIEALDRLKAAEQQKLLSLRLQSSASHASLKKQSQALDLTRQTWKSKQKDLSDWRSKEIDYKNKETALNASLKQCRNEPMCRSQTVQTILKHYESLKQEQEHKTRDYQKTIQQQKARIEVLENDQVAIKRLEKASAGAFHELDVCMTKNATCIQQNRVHQQKIEKLEKDLDEIAKGQLVVKHANSTNDMDMQRTIIDLRTKLEKLTKELSSVQIDRKRAKNDVRVLVERYNLLLREKQAGEKELAKLQTSLSRSETTMSTLNQELHTLRNDHQALQDQLKQAIYPTDRNVLEKRIELNTHQQTQLQKQLDRSVDLHAKLTTQVQKLTKENQDLKTIVEKQNCHTQTLEKMISQSAELNADLVNARALVAKRDKELTMLATQLAVIVKQSRQLKEEEEKLKAQLASASTPEEMDVIHEKLVTCRARLRSETAERETMAAALTKIDGLYRISQEKVTALVGVLKDNEVAKDRLIGEETARLDLQKSLQACQNGQKVATSELEAQLAVMKDKYQATLKTQEEASREYEKRMADLADKLKTTLAQKESSEKELVLSPQIPIPVAPTEDRIRILEQRVNQVIEKSQAERQAFLKNLPPTVTADHALAAQKLPSSQNLIAVKAESDRMLHEHDEEIMRLREKQLQTLLATMEAKAATAYTSKDIGSQLEDMQKRGQEREQSAMKDMIRMRALAEKLNAEVNQMKTMQQNVLMQARNTALAENQALVASQAPLAQWRPAMDTITTLSQAQKQALATERNQLLQQLQSQQTYVKQLEAQIPQMNRLVTTATDVPFPEVRKLSDYMTRSRDISMSALQDETNKLTSLNRTTSALESQMDAVLSQLSSYRTLVPKFASDRLPNAAQGVLAALDPPDKLAADMSLDDKVRWNGTQRFIIINPKADNTALIGGTDRYGNNPSGGMIRSVQDAARINSSRSNTAIQNGWDLVVISYTFHQPGVVMEHQSERLTEATLRQLQSDLPEGQLEASIVSIHGKKRMDLLAAGGSKQLVDDCSFDKCGATWKKLNSNQLIKDLVEAVENDRDKQRVISLRSNQSPCTIHIAELFLSMEKHTTSSLESVNLLDHAWITYLQPVMKKPDTKIDIFANILPSGDNRDQYNDWMKKVSTELNALIPARVA
jgi:hypothetical protein